MGKQVGIDAADIGLRRRHGHSLVQSYEVVARVRNIRIASELVTLLECREAGLLSGAMLLTLNAQRPSQGGVPHPGLKAQQGVCG